LVLTQFGSRGSNGPVGGLDFRFFYVMFVAHQGANMAIAPTLLPEFDHEMAGCRKSLERIPNDQFGYQPHAKSFTMSQLGTHLASIPGWLASTRFS
jgi:hypothetical protein